MDSHATSSQIREGVGELAIELPREIFKPLNHVQYLARKLHVHALQALQVVHFLSEYDNRKSDKYFPLLPHVQYLAR
jgi:hypothetical protein